jgi:hypothetical protein
MGHPLAPYVSRLAQAVAQHINQKFGTAIVAYLDDWLFFQPHLLAQDIIHEIQITINFNKSIIHPTSDLIYLGLRIKAETQQLQTTPDCLRHMMQLASLVTIGPPLHRRLHLMVGLGHELAYLHGHSPTATDLLAHVGLPSTEAYYIVLGSWASSDDPSSL